jgi:hypothetical protein
MAFDTRLLTGVGVLAAVTEAGNFARAAETLGLSVTTFEGSRDNVVDRKHLPSDRRKRK